MAVTDLIIEENRVTGVRLGDKGIDADGRPKPNYTPGAVVHAEAVVLGEGACGLLTAQAVDRFELDKDASPQTYALGIKELLHVPADSQRPGTVLHTFGFPLDADTFGGGFVYGMDAETVAVGLVVGLDYRNPEIDPHASFRAFKAHPAVQQHIAGGEVRSYGAKIIPEGGYFAVPRLAAPGVLLVGDGAGLLDATGLKGAHIACECGLFAGDTLAACWKENAWDKPRLQQYEDRVHESGSWKHQERYRNVRAAFQHGRLAGMLAMGTALFTRGRLPAGRLSSRADHELIGKSDIAPAFRKPQPGRGTDLDMLSDLYASGTVHEEDQPSHLTIRDRKRCVEECLSLYGAPCTRFCPAQVYEMDEETGELRINAANCLHCKTCRIKCPLQQVDWALPEGGGGPRYRGM
jgi:electron-transferring-flavoprotein dehydrogenase